MEYEFYKKNPKLFYCLKCAAKNISFSDLKDIEFCASFKGINTFLSSKHDFSPHSKNQNSFNNSVSEKNITVCSKNLYEIFVIFIFFADSPTPTVESILPVQRLLNLASPKFEKIFRDLVSLLINYQNETMIKTRASMQILSVNYRNTSS